MDIDSFKQDLLAAGATGVSLVNAGNIEIREEFRALCQSNECGMYGTNWSCPPACESLKRAREKMSCYSRALVIQQVSPLEDSFDFEGMMKAQREFTGLMVKAVNLAKTNYNLADFLALGAGACTICAKCTYPDEPCRHPDLMMPSMEAYGIDALSLAKLANLPCGNKSDGQPSVYYMGVIFF